uniref:Uncharacterized protein n=1 Tax=Meloidogyne enterolobii TaxID=390850 RepID=A0A6V7WRM4_MELEN|nr:unnamed protein product [Meloidogyne enterolobii]
MADPIPLPLVLNQNTNSENIRKILESNTIPRTCPNKIKNYCWPVKSPRIQFCLCVIGLVPTICY